MQYGQINHVQICRLRPACVMYDRISPMPYQCGDFITKYKSVLLNIFRSFNTNFSKVKKKIFFVCSHTLGTDHFARICMLSKSIQWSNQMSLYSFSYSGNL
ncbi:hypothetical protein MATL_G00255310 [Megalops atlanticus]|uniref:Uncharacterized protein n=1 Tax=Megalops atlanticus TaxID=7932 RepID=A0A9D3PBD6_MEGAT|nr:hypothetical protein MATL_G00255310 [Megalops atlanticus]